MADTFFTLGTRVDSASLNTALRQISSAIRTVEKRGVNVRVDAGKFTRPLGKITGATNEFTKSLEASNARVLAFGASAGAIYQVQRAFEFLLKSTIEVEKQLQDVNVILGESETGLARFGKGLFEVAGRTAQSINTVATAATELARQGLSTAETLQRTNDALVLTRLSGMDAAASVSSLTAALNTFNREALTSNQVINKLANVDAAFAVSTDDLAQAMRRVGSTAQDVGVSFDQLLAITASVQQTTARGGPVIGNALKSIFTRIQRTDTLDLLERLGVTVRDLEHQMLPAMQVLGNLAKKFPTLSKAQQAHTAEVVAGVFQMNNLRAILGDMSKEFSIYDKAVKVSTSSTNEAILRNELLNKTLDAQLKKTLALATQAAQKIGNLTLKPVAERVVGIMQKVLGDFNEKDGEEVGSKIAKGILGGLGSFLSGPGLLLITGFLGKLGINLSKFVKESGAQFMGLNTAAAQQKSLQESIHTILQKNPQLIKNAATSTEARVIAERTVLGILEKETQMMVNMEKVAASMAGMAVRGGTRVTNSGAIVPPAYMAPTARPPRRGSSPFVAGSAKGHVPVPNFDKRSALAEIIGAAEGGYKAGKIRQVSVPNMGRVTYNTRETIKHVPGFAQPFINPPANSRAGRKHKAKAIRQTGVDPYSVPNFAGGYAMGGVRMFPKGLTVGTMDYGAGLTARTQMAGERGFNPTRFWRSGPKTGTQTATEIAMAKTAEGRRLGTIPQGRGAIDARFKPNPMLREVWEQAMKGHQGAAKAGGHDLKQLVARVGGTGKAEKLQEIMVGRQRMDDSTAKTFFNTLMNPAKSGANYSKALGGEAQAKRVTEKIIYEDGSGRRKPRSFIAARKEATRIFRELPNGKSAAGSFHARAEDIHTSMLEKMAAGTGDLRLMPFSKVGKEGVGNTILDALVLQKKGGKFDIQGPAEFKPTFGGRETMDAGRDARSSLSFKSLFSSKSGDSGGMLHWLRDGLSKRQGQLLKNSDTTGASGVQNLVDDLNNYVVRTKVDDFKRLQGTVNESVMVQGETAAVKMEEIFGKNITGLLRTDYSRGGKVGQAQQDRDMASAYDKVMSGFGASKGYIPKRSGRTGVYDSDKIGGGGMGGKARGILEAILNSGKKVNVLMGPSGSGKSTYGKQIGPHVTSEGQLGKFDQYTVMYGGKPARQGGGLTAQGQLIFDAAKRTGGRMQAITLPRDELVRRRTGRLSGSGDKSFKRSRKQLEGAMYAPGTNYGYLSNIRKKGYNLELITKAMGHVPSFAKYQVGQKLPWGRGAGGRHLAVRDKNMNVHYDPKAGFHADLVRRSKLEGKTMDGGWLFPSGKYEKIKGHDGGGSVRGLDLSSQGLIPSFAGGMPFAPGMFSKALLKKVKDVSRHGDRPYYMLRDAGGSVVDVASHTHRGLMGLQKERMKYPDSRGIFTSKDHWNAPPVIASGGFLPSFAGRGNPLQRAFKREKEATGLPSSKIYATTVDTPKYKGPVVANRRDERTRADLMSAVRGHPNPSRAGITAGKGFVPNYADSIDVMGISSMAMMAGMMMQGMGKNAEQKQLVKDQQKDHKDAKQNVRDQKERVKRLQEVNKRAAGRRQMAQKQAEAARKQGQQAAKERMSARMGSLDPKTGTRGPSIKQLKIDQQKAADRIIKREVNKSIMHGTAAPKGAGMRHSGPAGLGFGGVHAASGLPRGASPMEMSRGINPATGLPHRPAYNEKIQQLRAQGQTSANRIIAQATGTGGATPRGAAGVHSGDKAAKDLTKKTLLLQQARDRESSAAGRQTEANRKREAAQRAAWAQDKKVLAGQEKLTNARAKEAAMAARVQKDKPPSRAAAFIREKGFGVGFGVQIAAGIAEQFVGDTHTVEGRKKKSVVKGIGTVAGMAGTGAMIGGPWGAGIGAAIGGTLAVMDFQKASKKTSEDYAKALQRETESRKKALLGAEAYIQMQTRMTGMVASGAGDAERRNMRRMMGEQLMNVQDPSLRKELVASAGDTSKMREAMSKVQEKVAMQEKKGMVGILSMKATEAKGSERAGLIKDLGKTLSGAFDLKGIDLSKLSGKDAAGMTVELKKMGMGAKEAGEMVAALTGKHKWMMRAAMEEASVYENLEEEVSRSTEGIQRMAVATADLNALMGKVMASFKQHSKLAEMTWNHSQKMSAKALESMMSDTTIGRGRREGFKLQNDLLANISDNTFKNIQSSKQFHQAVMEWTVKQSGKGGIMPKNIQEVQNEARRQLQTGSIDENKWRGIIEDGQLSKTQNQELEATLNQQMGIIEQNTLAMSQNNQLLITQHRLREMERHFQSRRKLQEGLRVGGQPGERGIIDALRNFMDVPRIPGEREKRRAARGELRGINDLEAMGFSFEDSVGKAFKEKALQKAARSEAPAALEALGMSAKDVNKVVSSGFNPKIAKELIDNMKSSQAELMAQIIDAVNVGDIAKEERQYKRKLLDAEFQSRNALIKALGGNVDTMSLLIGSNFDLIDANEAMSRTGWEQLGKRGEQDSGMMDHMSTMAELNQRVMAASTANMSTIMAKASSDFSTSLTRYRDESLILQNRINLQGKINEAALASENVAQLNLGDLGMRASVKQSSQKESPYMDFDPGGPVTDALGWLAGQTGGRLAAGLDEVIFGKQSGVNPNTKYSASDMRQIVSMTTEIKRLNTSGEGVNRKVENFRNWRVGAMTSSGPGTTSGVPGMSPEDQQIWAEARDQAMLIHEDKLGAANPEGQQNLVGMKNIRTTYDLFETMQELNDVLIEKGMKKGAHLDLDVGAEEWKGAFGGSAKDAEKAITAARSLLTKSMDEWRIGMLSSLSNWSGVKELLGRDTGFSGAGADSVQTNILPLFLAIQETMTRLGSMNDNIGKLDPNFDVDGAVTTYKKFWKSYDEAGELLMNELDMQFKSGRKMTADRASELKQQIDQYRNLRKPYDRVMEAFEARGMVGGPEINAVLRDSENRATLVPDASTAPLGSVRERQLSAKEKGLEAYEAELRKIAANPSASLSNFNAERGEGQISRQNTFRIRQASANWATAMQPSLNRERLRSGVSDETEHPQFRTPVKLTLPSDQPRGGVPKGSTVPIPVEISAISGKAKAIMDQSGVWAEMKKNPAKLGEMFNWSAGTDATGAPFAGGWSDPMGGSASDMVKMIQDRLAIEVGGAGYNWVDAVEMPMLAMQQSIDHLSEISEDGDNELGHLFAGKQDRLRDLLSAILTELISKSGLDEKAQEELRSALKLGPQGFKDALDELNRKEQRTVLGRKLENLRGQARELPVPAPFFPQKAISGKVTVGNEALMRPLQIKTRELFIGQGKSILERLMKEEKKRQNELEKSPMYSPPKYKDLFDPGKAQDPMLAGMGTDIPEEFVALRKLRDEQRRNVTNMARFLKVLTGDEKLAGKETGFWMSNVGANRKNVHNLSDTSPTAQALAGMRGQTLPHLTEKQNESRGIRRMATAIYAMRGKLNLPGMQEMPKVKDPNVQFATTLQALAGFKKDLDDKMDLTPRERDKFRADLEKEGGLTGSGAEDLVDYIVKGLQNLPRAQFDVNGIKVSAQDLIRNFQLLKMKSHGVHTELQDLGDKLHETSRAYEGERQRLNLEVPYHMQLKTPQPAGMYGGKLGQGTGGAATWMEGPEGLVSLRRVNDAMKNQAQDMVALIGSKMPVKEDIARKRFESAEAEKELETGKVKKADAQLNLLSQAWHGLPPAEQAGEKGKQLKAVYEQLQGLRNMSAAKVYRLELQMESATASGLAVHKAGLLLKKWKLKLDEQEVRSMGINAKGLEGINNKEVKSRARAVLVRAAADRNAGDFAKDELKVREAMLERFNPETELPETYDEWQEATYQAATKANPKMNINEQGALRLELMGGDAQASWSATQSEKLLKPGSARRGEYDKEKERIELLRADLGKGDKRVAKSDIRIKNLKRLDESFNTMNRALGTGDRVGKSVREGGLAPYEFQLLLQKVQTEAVKGMGGGLLQQAAIPSRLGEEQQGKIKTALGDLALLVKTDAMGETSKGLAVQRETAAIASLHKLEEDEKAVEKFAQGETGVATAKAAREKARNALFKAAGERPEADASEDEKKKHRDRVEELRERLEASKLAVEQSETAHVEANFVLIGANAKVTEATQNLEIVTNNVADARASLKDIEEEYGSTVALASRLMKQYANAEFIKTMEGLETSMAQASLRFQMLADSDKWDKLLKATQLLAETRLRLAIKERQLTEAAGITTPQDTRQARGDLTRQQLRTGQIGVWEAFGQDTLDAATAASAGWKEQLLSDMIDIREGMIDAFGKGWQAFSMEGAKAKDVAKQWARDFLGLINKAFYNATIGRLFRNIVSGGFSSYTSPEGQQEGGIIKAQNGMYVSGNRTGDRNPALLEDGEYVLNKNLVNRIGKKNLDDANFGLAPRFAAGGFVPPSNLDPSTWPQPPNMNRRLNPKQDQKRFDDPALRGQFMEDGVPAFAPPRWHDKQMTLEFYKYWNLKQNKQKLPRGMTPWGQAQSDSRRVRTLFADSGIGGDEMEFLDGFGLKEAKRPPQFLNGKIGPGWGQQLQWLGLPGDQEGAREELSEFGRMHPEALKHFSKSWLKSHKGWSNPQAYRKGGMVGGYQEGGVVSPYQKAWQNKLNQRQILQITGQIPSKGLFGQPLHQRRDMSEEDLREALTKSGRGDQSAQIPSAYEWENFTLSKEALAEKAELEAEKKRMARIMLEFRTDEKIKSAEASSNRGIAMFAPPGMRVPRTALGQKLPGGQTRHTSALNERIKDRATPGYLHRRLWYHEFMQEKGLIGEFENANSMGAFHQGNSQASRIYKFLKNRQSADTRHILSEKELLDESMPELIPHIGDYNERIFTEMGTSGLLMDPNISAPISELDKIGVGSKHRWSENYALHERLLKDRLTQGKGNAWYNKFIQAPNALPIGGPVGTAMDGGRWWNNPFAPLPKGMKRIPTRRNPQQGPSTPMPPIMPPRNRDGTLRIDPATGLPIGGGADSNSTMPGLGELPWKFREGGEVMPHMSKEEHEDHMMDPAVRKRRDLLRLQFDEMMKQLLKPQNKGMGPAPVGPRPKDWTRETWVGLGSTPRPKFAKGGVVGTYKEKGTARYKLKPGWDRSMGMTGADPLWEAMQKGKRVKGTAATMVEAGLIHSFDANDMEAAAVIYAETGPELYRQMDVVGNTLRNRKSSKGWSKDTSVHGAATRKHQFSAYKSGIANWKDATSMGAWMKNHFKKDGWAGFEAKFGASKTRAWQTALFYGSNKGQLSDRYGGVTSYTSPAPSKKKDGTYKYPTVIPGASGLTPFAHAKFAHQSTAGGINVGAARQNLGNVGFHLYDSPIEGDQPHKGTKYGTFLNTYTKASAGVKGAGGSSFAPFLQRMAERPTNYADRKKAGYKPKYRLQAPSSRKDLGDMWRLYGGHAGWTGRSDEEKLSANIQMATSLFNRNGVGSSASRRFLKQLEMKRILDAVPNFKELSPEFKEGGLVAFRGGGRALSGGSRAGYVAGGNHVDDDVRADLHNGDFVMTQKAVGKYGKSFFSDLQSGRLKFESGGVVDEEKDEPVKSQSEIMGEINDAWTNKTGVDDFDARYGNFQEGSEIVWGDRGDPAPKTNAGWQPTLEQKQSLEGGASLNKVYGDDLSKAWGGAPSEYGMAGIATQDKTWYGAGHMPGAGMISTFNEVEKGFSWKSANTLALNDPKRPSLARFLVSEDLSAHALDDSNNPSNEMKKKREGLFIDYKLYLKSEFENRKKQWDDFRRKKKQLLKGAWIQAAITVAAGAIKQKGSDAAKVLTDDVAAVASDTSGRLVLATTDAQKASLKATREVGNVMFNKPAYLNPAMQQRWAGISKWADSPVGAGLTSAATTAALSYGMGMEGHQIAIAAATAGATGATSAWYRTRGAGKDVLNAMNSSNPVIARAAIDQAHAANVITDQQKEAALKNMSIRSARSMDLSTQRAILSAENGNELAQKAFAKAQGGNPVKLARATEAKDAAQVKLANARSTRQGWIKNTNRRHPGMLERQHEPDFNQHEQVWAFKAEKIKELEAIELNWDQQVNAMEMRQKAQRAANVNVDHLGNALRKEGGPIGGYPYGRDTVPALVQGGEFIVSKDAAAGNYEFLNALNQQQISPQHLSSLPMARRGGGIRRYAEGGVVGAEMSQFDPLSSAGTLATPAGAEGVSDSLIQLVDIVQGIKDTFDKETGDKAREKALGGEDGTANKDGGVNQEITNNVNVTVNVSADGTATSETESSTESKNKDGEDEEDDAEKNERFAELMQGVVLQTIIEEQRPGGLLYKAS